MLSGSGDPHLLRGTPPPCGVGTRISIQRGLWRGECGLFSTTGFFSFSSRVAQLILGESACVAVNAEVLRPREEMGASEPEKHGEHATCSGTFRVTGCRSGSVGCSGLRVPPPRQRDHGFWNDSSLKLTSAHLLPAISKADAKQMNVIGVTLTTHHGNG